MRFSFVLVGLSGMLVTGLAAPSARADGCEEAWYQRNLIYKQAGYCFRTPRGIRAFGNAGCSYDAVEDVPLSARQRTTVGELKSYERANGCPQ
ncbi:YARHG domain-containing protein [Methylobacterium haplocladii]|uniref:YARHG domain-containing protein n=1 Tax=Methylobacterium haplocladii TaxID=1176176 RepID=A0A512IPN8_9HYPH|nr:YARHG domain-containing protein [Methylobacterium haplocladii]GEO99655.1 hypothetical protein MHA02_20430 [Methylobacterium haplocladii]GJD83349.1 hypothetical protein HPGCJGGD_1215 [Methylobacterium haplocladii]GLS58224.1 hypothetical protein GCM10007887_08810 [Methylobacterium haplocladii]